MRLAPLLIAVALAACAGPSAPAQPAPPNAAAQPARFRQGSLRLIVRIPDGAPPATKSLVISASTLDPGILIIERMVEVQPPDCVRTTGATLCTTVMPLNPNRWFAVAQTYDRSEGKGKQVGQGSHGFRIKSGVVTELHLSIEPSPAP